MCYEFFFFDQSIADNSAKPVRASQRSSSSVVVEHTKILGAVRNRKHHHKSGKRTRFVDLESPIPYRKPREDRSDRAASHIQLEDVERVIPLISPGSKHRKKKGRHRSSKRKQIGRARKEHTATRRFEHRPASGAMATKNASPKKKLRLDPDMSPDTSPDAQTKAGIRAPSPVILNATPSGDDVLMLKGHGLIKSDSQDGHAPDILLLRGDLPKQKRDDEFLRPLPELGPPRDKAKPKRAKKPRGRSTSEGPAHKRIPLAPIPKSKSERSRLREKYASAKRMGERLSKQSREAPLVDLDRQPSGDKIVALQPDAEYIEEPAAPKKKKRNSSLRDKFASAKAMGTQTAHLSFSLSLSIYLSRVCMTYL